MLTVALDATPLAGDRTGIGVAAAGMIGALAEAAELDLVGFGLTASGWAAVRSHLPPGVRAARGPMPARALLRVWGVVDFPVVESWTGPVDVVHGTNFVVPPARRAGRIVSVWDLTAVRYPEFCSPTSRRYPHLVGRAIDRGAWVHTGSRSVADEIVDHFGADPGRVVVVAPGVDAGPRLEPSPEHSPPYVLALGTVEPRKDFPGLVRAFDMLAADHPNLELWIAGPEGWGEAQLSETLARARHRDRVRRLGWLSDVGRLLRGATLLAYPSVYEGFGFPPLEAMAAGVPVVATTAGSVPEVVGDAAVLVAPGDPAALAEAISKVLTDETLRSTLVDSGYARAGAFTWAESARALSAAYAEIAAAS